MDGFGFRATLFPSRNVKIQESLSNVEHLGSIDSRSSKLDIAAQHPHSGGVASQNSAKPVHTVPLSPLKLELVITMRLNKTQIYPYLNSEL